MENVNQIIRKKIVNKKNWKKNNEQKMHTWEISINNSCKKK